MEDGNDMKTWIFHLGLAVIYINVYRLFGSINIPMGIYKASLAFLCVYIPIVIWLFIRYIIQQEEDKQSDKKNIETPKPICNKVYGSSDNE